MNSEQALDLLVVGGGPAGATAALYAARAGLRTLVIDKGPGTGALGGTERIANYPGIPGPISGEEVVERIRQQAESFGARFVTDRVVGTELRGQNKAIFTAQNVFEAQAVIIATGGMARGNALPGERELLGRGVSYCASCDAAFFKNRSVVVAGGNQEAAEEAFHLSRFVGELHLLIPGAELKADPHIVRDLKNHPRVKFHEHATLLAVEGEGEVNGVLARVNGEERRLAVEGVFLYLGGRAPATSLFNGQLEMTGEGCLRLGPDLQTSVVGVFAAGDVVCSHPKQAVIAAADGATAALGAEKYLRGREQVRKDWVHV